MTFRSRMPIEEYLRSPLNHPSLSSQVKTMFDPSGKCLEFLFVKDGNLWRKVKDGERVCVTNGSLFVAS